MTSVNQQLAELERLGALVAEAITAVATGAAGAGVATALARAAQKAGRTELTDVFAGPNGPRHFVTVDFATADGAEAFFRALNQAR